MDPIMHILKIVKVLVRESLALDYIGLKSNDFFISEYPTTLVFYILPKIHKTGFPPPVHPIITSYGSVLESISKFVDFLTAFSQEYFIFS